MMDIVALHQDYQTLHEICKAVSAGLSFRGWMEANEPADVTADAFTERVNSADFRARYWAEAGGSFTPREQAHLDTTPAASPMSSPPRSDSTGVKRRSFAPQSIVADLGSFRVNSRLV